VKCKVIEWNKNGWVDPSVDTDGYGANLDTIRTPLHSPVDRDVPEDSALEYEFAL
jgi:hypothetical protein